MLNKKNLLSGHSGKSITIQPQDDAKKTEEVNMYLKGYGADCWWKKRKQIMRWAIENFQIHPDKLDGVDGTPLYQCVLHDKKASSFARFLFDHGADPAQQRGREYIIKSLKTVSMAKLFYNRGGRALFERCGTEVLVRGVWHENKEPALIGWLARNGADVNGYYKGQTALLFLTFMLSSLYDDSVTLRAGHLIYAGASLASKIEGDVVSFAGYTAPQIIRKKLEGHAYAKEAWEIRKVNQLRSLRTALIQASSIRHEKIKADLKVHFRRKIARIICFFVYEDYKAIEAEPYPEQPD